MDRKTMLQYLEFKTLNDIPDNYLKHMVSFKKGFNDTNDIKIPVAISYINYVLADSKMPPITDLLDFKNITRDKLKMTDITQEWKDTIQFHFKIRIIGGKANEITAAAIIKKIINTLPNYELVIQTTKIKNDGAIKVVVTYSIIYNKDNAKINKNIPDNQ
jgi:phosphotransferase system IIB component